MKSDWYRAATLVDAVGSALGVIQRDALEPDEIELAEQLSRSVTEGAIRDQEATIACLEREDIHVVTILDDGYPFNLRLVFNRPPVLFISGDLEPANRKAVAVVGTRHPTSAGVEVAQRMASDLTVLGFTVVAALAAGGRTVGVMGTGINHIYPPENRDLAARISRQGALVSQFWPETGPTRHTFPLRNAVLSGLSTGVLVVEGSSRSGSSMQAMIAFSQGRPVFFADGLSAEQDWVRHYLDQGWGRVVSTADEIVEATRYLTEPVDRETLT
jgi:DNA processing protein